MCKIAPYFRRDDQMKFLVVLPTDRPISDGLLERERELAAVEELLGRRTMRSSGKIGFPDA